MNFEKTKVGDIEVVSNPYLPDNTLFLQCNSKFDDFPIRLSSFRKAELDNFNYNVERYYYYTLRLLSPGKFINVLNLFDIINRDLRKVILSIKQKARLQRRLNRSSNIRRRKRFKELQLRKRRGKCLP